MSKKGLNLESVHTAKVLRDFNCLKTLKCTLALADIFYFFATNNELIKQTWFS